MRSEGDKSLVEQTSEMDSFEMPRWKRAVDITCSLAAMALLALLTLLAGIVMKIASPGPVLFRQERVGYRGRRFMSYRFRTMHVGSTSRNPGARSDDLNRSTASMMKMNSRDGARLIPGSRLLRALRVDELPQIINVLRGEMSLVGSRPCAPYEYEKYLPEQRGRINAVPGLTGLWQVSGRTRITVAEMIRLDNLYVQKKSFWLDLKIMLMTVPALLLQVREARNEMQSSKRSGTSAKIGA